MKIRERISNKWDVYVGKTLMGGGTRHVSAGVVIKLDKKGGLFFNL